MKIDMLRILGPCLKLWYLGSEWFRIVQRLQISTSKRLQHHGQKNFRLTKRQHQTHMEDTCQIIMDDTQGSGILFQEITTPYCMNIIYYTTLSIVFWRLDTWCEATSFKPWHHWPFSLTCALHLARSTLLHFNGGTWVKMASDGGWLFHALNKWWNGSILGAKEHGILPYTSVFSPAIYGSEPLFCMWY